MSEKCKSHDVVDRVEPPTSPTDSGVHRGSHPSLARPMIELAVRNTRELACIIRRDPRGRFHGRPDYAKVLWCIHKSDYTRLLLCRQAFRRGAYATYPATSREYPRQYLDRRRAFGPAEGCGRPRKVTSFPVSIGRVRSWSHRPPTERLPASRSPGPPFRFSSHSGPQTRCSPNRTARRSPCTEACSHSP